MLCFYMKVLPFIAVVEARRNITLVDVTLTASDPCMVILNSLTARDPKYRVLVSDRSPVTVSNTVRSKTPF